MTTPKISIITASFNSEKTIADTLYSILNQEYKNFEYILIDGGSTDKTISIIKDYEDLFSGKITWRSERDFGIYDAWNKGLKLSTGDWISFVGSDDIVLKNAYAKYVDVINTHPGLNFISSKILQVKTNLYPLRIVGQPWSKRMNSYCCIAHVGSLHHKSLFSQKGQFNPLYRIAGDYELLLRCSDIIIPYYMPVVTMKAREGGASGHQILNIAKETLKAKVMNKSKTILICYLEYYLMIIKYLVRTKLINLLMLPLINRIRTNRYISGVDFNKS